MSVVLACSMHIDSHLFAIRRWMWSLEIVGEVLGRESVVVHITILSTWGKCEAIWRKVNCVHWTEMTVDLGQLLGEYYARQTDFEATCTLIGQSHISCVLTTAHKNVELLPVLWIMKGAHSNCATRFARIAIFAHFFKCFRMKQFCATISGGSEKHSVVMRQRDLVDFGLVNLNVFKYSTGANIDNLKLATLCSNVESFVKRSPCHACELMLLSWHNLLVVFWSVFWYTCC